MKKEILGLDTFVYSLQSAHAQQTFMWTKNDNLALVHTIMINAYEKENSMIFFKKLNVDGKYSDLGNGNNQKLWVSSKIKSWKIQQFFSIFFFIGNVRAYTMEARNKNTKY